MKWSTSLPRGLVAASVLFLALPHQAQAPSCALLKPADLAGLLGGTAVARQEGGACTWTIAGSPRKLIGAAMKATGPAAEQAYAAARQGAARGRAGTVTDEAGLGDKAFASLESFGVVLVTLKQGRVLQLQLWTGAPGTAKDVAALRPVAKKAVAAL